MPIKIIDPLSDDVDMSILQKLLLQNDEANKTKITKTIHNSTHITLQRMEKFPLSYKGDSYHLKHSLLKVDNTYFVIDETIGTGSNTKVKVLPICFRLNSTHQYERITSDVPEIIVKVIPKSINSPTIKNALTMLTVMEDPYAKVIPSDKSTHKCYLIQSRAKGLPLSDYLYRNQKLTLEERIVLIHKITDAVLALNKKGYSHLDLKPENIFFDGEKITLIDADSGASNDTVLTLQNSDVHVTTAQFLPMNCYQERGNSPQQIDCYSLAGVFGFILGDLNKSWSYSEIFSKKMQFTNRYSLMMCTDVDKRQYCFDTIEKSKWLQNGKEKMVVRNLVDLVSNLGAEHATRRMTLDNFKNKLIEFTQKESKLVEREENHTLNTLSPIQRAILLDKYIYLTSIQILKDFQQPNVKELLNVINNWKNGIAIESNITFANLLKECIQECIHKKDSKTNILVLQTLLKDNNIRTLLPGDLLKEITQDSQTTFKQRTSSFMSSLFKSHRQTSTSATSTTEKLTNSSKTPDKK